MRTPIAITAIALTALLASAATVGAERLITGADIKDGSITHRDIKAGSLKVDRLEPAARHRAFIAKQRRSRQTSLTNTAVATLKVPAGSYAVQATLSVSNLNSPSTNMSCMLQDSAGALRSEQQWMTSSPGQVIPMTLVGVATYTASATITLQCTTSVGTTFGYNGTILAEQVTTATRS
ncbi:MAG: hypothetical protein RL190_584 [Actinomycetota bacterium]|jgi:hypothetical protein